MKVTWIAIYSSLVPRFSNSYRLGTRLHFSQLIGGKNRGDKMDLDLYADLENPFFPVSRPDSKAADNKVFYTRVATRPS